MADKMRWRYADTNPVIAAVDSATVIEIGDLLWQDKDDAKPASHVGMSNPQGNVAQAGFARLVLGVAMQRTRNGDTAPIRVSTTGVFEMECAMQTWELGDLVGAIPNDTGRLQDQAVSKVPVAVAIERVARRVWPASGSVLIDIRSTVMTGGVVGRHF